MDKKLWWYWPLHPTHSFYAPLNDRHVTHGRCYLTSDCIYRWKFRTPHARVWNRDSHDSYCWHGFGKERDSKRSWFRLKCSSKHVLYSSEQGMNLHSLLYLSCLAFLINFILIFARLGLLSTKASQSIKVNNSTSIYLPINSPPFKEYCRLL